MVAKTEWRFVRIADGVLCGKEVNSVSRTGAGVAHSANAFLLYWDAEACKPPGAEVGER